MGVRGKIKTFGFSHNACRLPFAVSAHRTASENFAPAAVGIQLSRLSVQTGQAHGFLVDGEPVQKQSGSPVKPA